MPLAPPQPRSTDRRGLSGPHDAGHYNSISWEANFFNSDTGSWSTPYGHFFLSWYSGLLIRHAERVLSRASDILNKPGRPRVFKAVKEVGECIGVVVGSCQVNIARVMLLIAEGMEWCCWDLTY